jgi:hypothetical protein
MKRKLHEKILKKREAFSTSFMSRSCRGLDKPRSGAGLSRSSIFIGQAFGPQECEALAAVGPIRIPILKPLAVVPTI